MVDKLRHLGAVPDQEISGENEGLVTVRTDGISELHRWLRRPPKFKETFHAPIDLPSLNSPCQITGAIRQPGYAPTKLISWLKPIDDRDLLPADKTTKLSTSAVLRNFDPRWITNKTIILHTKTGTTRVEITPERYLAVTTLVTDDDSLIANRFSRHASVLQGLIEVLLINQRGTPHAPKQLNFVLRPMLGNGASPRPPRAS